MNGKRTAGRSWVSRGVTAVVVLGALAGTGTAAQAVAAGRPPAAADVISTVAGGVGGPGPGAQVGTYACGVAFGSGSLYAAGQDLVRKVNPQTDWLTTPAGTGLQGVLGDTGAAGKAALSGACGVAVDHSGNLVVADTFHRRVRVVAAATGTFYGQSMTAGHIYTVAGDGHGGFSGDGGPARQATLSLPEDVAVDPAGNLVITDSGSNERVRVVAAATGKFYGQSMTAGNIYTVAGDGHGGFSGDGGPATKASIYFPHEVAVDGAGNLVFADAGNDRIRVVAAASGTFYGQSMIAGDIYTVAGDGQYDYSGDGGPATSAGMSPTGVAVDAAGNLVIADNYNNRVRVVAEKSGTMYGQSMIAGDIYTVAGGGTGGLGDGGLATSAELNVPVGVAVDGTGNLVIADQGNDRVRVVAAATGTMYGQSMTAGHIYTVAGNGTGFYGDGVPAARAEVYPAVVTTDSAGNVVIADTNNRIRVLATTAGTFYGRAMIAGDIYTVAGNGTAGFSGDGGPAIKAELYSPDGVAVDATGNLVISDLYNNRVRVVAVKTGTFYGQSMIAGDIYTVAGDGKFGFSGDGGPATSAEIWNPAGLSVDSAGNLVFSDGNNDRIRVVAVKTGTFYGLSMTAGDIYTVAGNGTSGYSGDGGPATSAELGFPNSVSVDAAGNLLIADGNNNRIRVVAVKTGTFYGLSMTAGDIYTVAGNGTSGFSGDGGPATSAELSFPGSGSVSVDAVGNLLIADSGNNRIRVVAVKTGTFYGQSMTVGDIYTVAGGGTHVLGDGGPATSAKMGFPSDVSADAAGNLVIADTSDGRIREVTG